MRKLRQEQLLPIDLATAWDYFATPANLNEVTPPDMHFEVVSELPARMYEGLIILYKIKPMLNLPLDWCTEITHIRPPSASGASAFFVDEQRKGPYRIWHHEHHFEAVAGGTRMVDLLHYEIGKSIFGSLAGHLFVHARVDEIFSYRRQALARRFGTG